MGISYYHRSYTYYILTLLKSSDIHLRVLNYAKKLRNFFIYHILSKDNTIDSVRLWTKQFRNMVRVLVTSWKELLYM